MENDYRVGQTIYKGGCFTLEGYIIEQNLSTIANRLGLPQLVVDTGVYVAYALRVPGLTEFELAGTTYDSTDNFVTYGQGPPQYNAQEFQKIYSANAAIPVNFLAIKKQYHNCFGQNKLVKVLAPAFNHYPRGGMTPQFFIKSRIPCYVAAFIPPMGNFNRREWSTI